MFYFGNDNIRFANLVKIDEIKKINKPNAKCLVLCLLNKNIMYIVIIF